jgi:hypothetical protein
VESLGRSHQTYLLFGKRLQTTTRLPQAVILQAQLLTWLKPPKTEKRVVNLLPSFWTALTLAGPGRLKMTTYLRRERYTSGFV